MFGGGGWQKTGPPGVTNADIDLVWRELTKKNVSLRTYMYHFIIRFDENIICQLTRASKGVKICSIKATKCFLIILFVFRYGFIIN